MMQKAISEEVVTILEKMEFFISLGWINIIITEEE